MRAGLRTGVRVAWTAVADGSFFCPRCGGDRNYERRTGRRRLELLGVPLVRGGVTTPVLACATCATHVSPQALEHPTSTRLAALLGDGVRAVALAVLALGGTEHPAAVRAAVETVHAAGYPECTEEELLSACAALRGYGADAEEARVGVEIALHAALGPLVPHLAAPGRASLLVRGARVALADGPYLPAERAVLASLGSALELSAGEIDALLAAAPERR
ncbi:TerB family tellurite resistance protein [Streptomyces sp. JJ66]|uniref:TerB family tellurite resistance protein n=1 Tax=Streptomyces sp. JJ66 TaxID=2803843 RepID=UPI001C5A13ED|nr:TerB family tellurite resistance protein [Streptomyces sp. JJ66]MBW1601030.1 TerB family tellurite resistance protein [Streptomyces sp. JJ66]